MMESAEDRRLVLVPVDGSEISIEGLKRAARLCRSRRSVMEVMYVMKPLDLSRSPGLSEVYRFDRRIGEAEKRLDEWVRPYRQEGLVIRSRVLLHQEPARAIVEEAQASGAELVVMGTRGRPWWSQILLCSVAEEVVRRSPCPVLIVRAGEGGAADGGALLKAS